MVCRLSRRLVLLAVLAAVAPTGFARAQAPLPVDAQLTFLSTAKVVKSRPIGKGITGALRVTLSDGTLTHDAAFQAVAQSPRFDGKKRAGELRFVDHYRYNIAAWQLAVLLGLGPMMPATVERTIQGKIGALSWWIDDVMMDEEEREKRDAQPPSSRQFGQERQRMLVFAELVRDTDRNKGNVVYTKDWRLIMLDFTRAFRLDTELRAPAALPTCDRKMFAAMKALTRERVEKVVGESLLENEVTALLARRDLLVAHFERLIAQRGERAVLY